MKTLFFTLSISLILCSQLGATCQEAFFQFFGKNLCQVASFSPDKRAQQTAKHGGKLLAQANNSDFTKKRKVLYLTDSTEFSLWKGLIGGKPASYYLNNFLIPESISSFYLNGNPNSEPQKDQVVKDLMDPNLDEKVAPFYFYVLSQLVMYEDGAYAEVLTSFAHVFVKKNPSAVCQFFEDETENGKRALFHKYSDFIAFDIYNRSFLSDTPVESRKEQYAKMQSRLNLNCANCAKPKECFSFDFCQQIQEYLDSYDE